MEIACYSTHTVDLKNRQHTQPGSLKISNQIQRTSRKKNPSKRQLFHLPRPMLYNMRSTDTFQLLQVMSPTYSSQIYMSGFAKKQFYPQNSLSDKVLFKKTNTKHKMLSTEFQTKMYCLRHLFFITFSLHSKMIVMQQFNDKNILIFYYTAARSQLSIKSTQTSLNENLQKTIVTYNFSVEDTSLVKCSPKLSIFICYTLNI